MLKVLLAWTC